MIVISGALVLVALVLLVIGVTMPELAFVYASIAVSLVSLVFLVIGILQRRGESPAGDAAQPPVSLEGDEATSAMPDQEVTAVPVGRAVGGPVKTGTTGSIPVDAAVDQQELGGTVLVVAGRPRYHVEGCRYLAGKQAEPVDVLDARDEGFTACGVCKPDQVLAAELEDDEQDVVEPAAVAPPLSAPATGTGARKAASRRVTPQTGAPAKTISPAKKTGAVKAAAARVSAKAALAKAATTAPALSETVPAKAAKAAKASPAKASPTKAAKATPAKAAAVKAVPAGGADSVVVIPDRDRYHRDDCRYVRGVQDAELITRSKAKRQGYDRCGVCKP